MVSLEDVLYPESKSEHLFHWFFVASIVLLQLAALVGGVYLLWHMWLFELSLLGELAEYLFG